MARPSVSVIVPYAGSGAGLQELQNALQRLETGPGDEVIVADNRVGSHNGQLSGIEVIAAASIPTPAFARNAAAKRARGEWLVFIDADTVPSPGLLDRYFEPMPEPGTAVLAGAIRDVAPVPTLTARHVVARAQMSQRTTLDRARPYAQTANCAVRRTAFEQIGGFFTAARAGEDADLCFRLQDAGWSLEERPEAMVEHRSRTRPRQLLRQLVLHGSGAAWVNGRFPGSFPRSGVTRRVLRSGREAVTAGVRGEREAALFALLDIAGACAFELGRLRSNLRSRLPAAKAG